MRRRDRGTSLMELLAAMALMLIVMSLGYAAYNNFLRADDVESTRERLNLNAQNAMARIKLDVRSATGVTTGGRSLVVRKPGEQIEYVSLGRGLERRTPHGRRLYGEVAGQFSKAGRGVNVSLTAKSEIHGRVIRVDLNSFFVPRS